ncbi:MAG: hypothetical protein OCD76_01615 [Reichenbachiella sp.]
MPRIALAGGTGDFSSLRSFEATDDDLQTVLYDDVYNNQQLSMTITL